MGASLARGQHRRSLGEKAPQLNWNGKGVALCVGIQRLQRLTRGVLAAGRQLGHGQMQAGLHRTPQAPLGHALLDQSQAWLHLGRRRPWRLTGHHGPTEVHQSVAVRGGLGRRLGGRAVSRFSCRLLAHLIAQ